MKTLFMETTEIPPERTLQEVQTLLVKYGARAILTEYDHTGNVKALSFKVMVNGIEMPFRVPCRWGAIAEFLRKRAKVHDYSWNGTYDSDKKRRAGYEDKARRVAWRQVLRWIQAQLAFVDSEMVSVQEVFFQYAQIDKQGSTVFEHFQRKGFQLEYKGTSDGQ